MLRCFLFAKTVYYANDICSALFIFRQRQTFALYQMLSACTSSDVEKKNAYCTKISVGPQKHLVELERKAEDNKQSSCFIYSFVSMTLNPSEDKLPE